MKFVRGEDNMADIFTKNMSRVTFTKHSRRFVCDGLGEELDVKKEYLVDTDG